MPQLMPPSREREVAPPEKSTSEASNAQAGQSNAQAAAALPADENAGLAVYTDTLGKFLGPELYKTTHKELSFEKLSGLGHSVVDQALTALMGQVGGIKGLQADPEALAGLEGILKGLAGGAADQWLAAEGPALQQALVGWTDANPKAIAGVALLAAAGAVLANVKLPELHRKLNITEGLTADLAVNLGRIRNIGLEKIKAQLDYASGPLVAAMQVTHEGAATTGEASAAYTGDGKEVSAKASFDKDGIVVAGIDAATDTKFGKLSGSVVSDRAAEGPVGSVKLVGANGATTTTDQVDYDAATGKLDVSRQAMIDLGDGYSAAYTGKRSSDGSSTTAGAVDFAGDKGSAHAEVSNTRDANGDMDAFLSGTGKYAADDYTAEGSAKVHRGADGLVDSSLAVGGTKTIDALKLALDASVSRGGDGSMTSSLKGGVNYTGESFQAALDGAVAVSGGAKTVTMGGSVDATIAENHKVGAKFNAILGEQQTLELSAYYGFKDPNQFRSWLLEYQYSSGADEHQIKAALEEHIGDLQLRAKGQATFGLAQTKYDLDLHAAYPMGSDVLGVAGVHYSHDMATGTRSAAPELGIQYKGVQVLASYDVGRKEATLKLGIPF